MTEHTPGPWHCTTEVPSDEVCLVAWIDSPDYPGEREWLQSEADARLIAAAPDLLEALEELLATAIPNFDAGEQLRAKIGLPDSDLKPQVLAARDAIAKAKGVTHSV